MPSTIDFYLPAFDFAATAIEALYHGIAVEPVDAHVRLEMEVTVAQMQEMFLFHTDAVDLTDVVPVDLLYLLNTVSDLSGVISGSVCVNGGTDDAHYASDNVTNYVLTTPSVSSKNSSANQLVYTAKNIFNVCAGVDLFENEADFMTNLNTDSQASLNAELNLIKGDGWKDADYLVAEAAGMSHPSKIILQNIINAQPARLADLTDYSHTDVLSQTAYKMPILNGDSIQFVMNVTAGQATIAGGVIADRTYRFKLNVVTSLTV